MVTLVFIHLHLHEINSDSIPALHQVVYLWMSLFWFTASSRSCITTKINLSLELIPFMLLVMQEYMKNPNNSACEPADNESGCFRMKNIEFITLDIFHIVEHNKCRYRIFF